MELYKVAVNKKFKLLGEPHLPPAAPKPTVEMFYRSPTLDGSYCNCYGEDGVRYYFAAWTEVEEIDDA